ncbi:MAG TPA: type II toxin-antitoxin system mRNA interferase toxin, RelE/StbE family [Candidatus Paceibacterota bacterium]
MQIIIHRTFAKQFAKVDGKIKSQFRVRRDLFMQSPHHPILETHPLTGNRTGQWSFNINGDWRAVFEYKDRTTIVLLEIGTHSSLYK